MQPVSKSSKSITSTSKFPFNEASPVARLEKLLFSEYLSDVVFKVGTSKELIHAHKTILALASEVFYAQFNGHFAEANQNNRDIPIVIQDIESDAFREVLNYIYCEKVNLTGSNVMDIFYAAQKYMLTALKGLCEKFLKTSVDETNVLKIFESNRKYGLADVDNLCLEMIQENPILCFKMEDDFTALSKESLDRIVGCKTMNCLTEQVKEACVKWCKMNNVNEQPFIPSKNLQCRKLRIFGSPYYTADTESLLSITVMQPLYLYGVGIFIGSQVMSTPDCEKVTITISDEVGNLKLTKEVPLKNDIYVEKFLFEKITVTSECSLKVRIRKNTHNSRTKLFWLYNIAPADLLGKVTVSITGNSKCCVAYLLYNVDEHLIPQTTVDSDLRCPETSNCYEDRGHYTTHRIRR